MRRKLLEINGLLLPSYLLILLFEKNTKEMLLKWTYGDFGLMGTFCPLKLAFTYSEKLFFLPKWVSKSLAKVTIVTSWSTKTLTTSCLLLIGQQP